MTYDVNQDGEVNAKDVGDITEYLLTPSSVESVEVVVDKPDENKGAYQVNDHIVIKDGKKYAVK